MQRVPRVLTDNAENHVISRDFSAAIGARHKAVKPHCPWQNGKVERFNRTLQAEWAHHDVLLDNDAAPPRWRPGSITTTLNAVTTHSTGARHQPRSVTNLKTRYTWRRGTAPEAPCRSAVGSGRSPVEVLLVQVERFGDEGVVPGVELGSQHLGDEERELE
ncbi:Integrase core domain-containing protein [Lentzea albida]|uniref:Integrase core domain-containing protein n=1 Tax=Lentzea albida TaxID=65499 RepID=A0A1H9MF16_9PSEU|nr:Integrase core domain-containing protein [Lentzea albida]